jgi:hypothetical protein
LETLGIIFYLHPYSNNVLKRTVKTPKLYLYYYRDKDAKEIDLIAERDGRLHPIEIKKTAAPEKKMIRSFSVIERAPLLRGTGAILCLTERLGAFDRENLIVPITLI